MIMILVEDDTVSWTLLKCNWTPYTILYMDDFYLTWMLYWMIFILAELSNGLLLTYLNFFWWIIPMYTVAELSYWI